MKITQAQQRRIVMAAIRALRVIDEKTADVLCAAILAGADDPSDLGSLLEVFPNMTRAVTAEVRIMEFEISDREAPSSRKH